MNLLAFGDLFAYINDTYVYLASTGPVTYAAKIVKEKDARSLVEHVDNIMMNGDDVRRKAAQDNITYRFVVLRTKGYEGDIAKLDRTNEQRDEARFISLDQRLCEADMIALQKEVIDAPLPRGLKKLITDLDVESTKVMPSNSSAS